MYWRINKLLHEFLVDEHGENLTVTRRQNLFFLV